MPAYPAPATPRQIDYLRALGASPSELDGISR